MGIDEESNIAFKEGFGKLVRGTPSSYYLSIKGTWARGMIHGKRTKTLCNLNVFPRGYYQGSKNVKSLAFISDVKKGIWNGAAQIIINGKKRCSTRFAD